MQTSLEHTNGRKEDKPFGRYSQLKAYFAKPSMTDKHPVLEISYLSLQPSDLTEDYTPDDGADTDKGSSPRDANGRVVTSCIISATIDLVKTSIEGTADDQEEQISFTVRRKARLRQYGKRLMLMFGEAIQVDIFSLLNASRKEIWQAQHFGRLQSTDVALPENVHAKITFAINIRSTVLSSIISDFTANDVAEMIKLETSWEQLPRCANLSKPQDVVVPVEKRSLFAAQMSAGIAMSWEDKRATTSRSEDKRLHISGPESAQVDGLAPRYRLTLQMHAAHIKRTIQNDLTCPLCLDRKDFESFEKLRLHFTVMHRRFDFEYEDDHSAHRLFTVSKIINVFMKKQLPQSTATPTSIPQSQMAESFSNATPDFAEEPAPVKRGRGRPRKHKKPSETETGGRLYASLPPNQIPDLPGRKPEYHRVPKVTDAQGNIINFYRTSSKRPLKAGEMITESDDETDEKWLQDRQREQLKRLKMNHNGNITTLSAEEIEFVADFNTYIDLEERYGSSGDRLKRDAVVRFARKYQHKLLMHDWRKQFERKLDRLQLHGIINEDDRFYCLKRPELDPIVSDDEGEPVDGVNGHVDAGQGHRQKPPSLKEICVCGNRVFGIRKVAMCAQQGCARETFHMSCVGLQTRSEDWVCDECQAKHGLP